MKHSILFGIILILIIALGGCQGDSSDSIDIYYDFKDPSAEPIKAAIRTSVPLAYAASVAMTSINDTTPSNATVNFNTCSSIPFDCAAMVTISDDDSALPLKFGSYGTIIVLGYWTSPEQAIFTVSFSGGAGSNLFPVQNISLIPVIKNGSSLKIVYENIDVNTTVNDPATLTVDEINAVFLKLNVTASNDASANVNMDAWITDVNDAGTPAEFSDDTYSISGGGQYIETGTGSVSVLQLGMALMSMGPECELNPVSGLAAINELENSYSNVVLATALILSESACNGTAQVTLATGNYLMSIGESISLNLLNP